MCEHSALIKLAFPLCVSGSGVTVWQCLGPCSPMSAIHHQVPWHQRPLSHPDPHTNSPQPHQPHPLPPPDYTHLLHSWAQYETTLTVYTLMMSYDCAAVWTLSFCWFAHTYMCGCFKREWNKQQWKMDQRYGRGRLSKTHRELFLLIFNLEMSHTCVSLD